MCADVKARIRGYVSPADIMNFIRQKYAVNVNTDIKVNTYQPLVNLDFNYKLQPGHENDDSWTVESGGIWFKHNDKHIRIFYDYSNINSFENADYYAAYNLSEMVNSETTALIMSVSGDISIIESIVAHFGGGWIDRNDCDDVSFEPVVPNKDESIKPILHVTMKDIYEKFGAIVVIDD